KSQQPTAFYNELFSTYGNTPDAYFKYSQFVIGNTMAFSEEKWSRFKADPSIEALRADPAYATAAAFIKNYNEKFAPAYTAFTASNNELGRLYLKGILEKDKAKASMMYPDANFTMRVSYGNVKSYSPKDGLQYDYITTMKGVMEKYVPGDYEFDLPKKYIDLYKAKDFGRYADAKEKDIVVGFITTNDITGGNSGSPVINANGELIGLAFDGNYEALSHKLAFDKDLNRTINVDVRYVLWCIEKLGGAKHIVDELKLVTK
ncbi:MAG: Peptidase, partial [Segetibacter sp.]|nr:Peptidase [Segetibacter sp.]